MKSKSVFSKVLSFCLSLVLVVSGGITPTNAEEKSNFEEKPNNLFRIELKSNDASMTNFSSIVFHVYSASLGNIDEENGLDLFEETFAFDVSASVEGLVEFEKPSSCFAVTIELESIPKGFGSDKLTEFYQQDTYSSAYLIEKIDHVESKATTLRELGDFTPYDSKKNKLNALFDSICSVEKNELLESMLYKDNLTIPYQISAGIFETLTDVKLDISNISIFERILYLYNEGYITNEEKINYYCDSILGGQFKNVVCIEEILDEISQFVNSNASTKEIEDKVNIIFKRPVERTRETASIPSYNSTYTNTDFSIHYDSSTCSYTEAVTIANYMTSLRSQYITMGFSTPILESSSTTYNVYVTPSSGGEGILASTFQVENNGNKCASYIVIYNFDTVTSLLRETLGHEYFHAVQNAYNRTSGWFKEACANWGGVKTSGYDTNSREWFINYLESQSYETVYNLEGYQCYFIPFCIQKDYGGESTIVEFYNLYADCSLNCSNDILMNTVTNAIHNKGYLTGSFDKAFEKSVVYNAYPRTYYNSVYSNTVDNPFTNRMSAEASSYSSSSKSVKKLGCLFYNFVPAVNSYSTLTVTVTVSSSNVKCRYVRTTSSGVRYITTPTFSSLMYTMVQYNFGNSNSVDYAVIPYCLNTTNCTVTVVATKALVNTYKVTNVGSNKCLNISGNNVTSLYNHQNVCLWSDSGTNEQKWYIPSIGSGVYIRSVINTSYGLNVYRVGSPWNCDLFPISGNETDAQVAFIAVTGGYKIKLYNYDLYLTVSASSNGSNVYWSASSSSTYQVWSLAAV
ncbi:MAG: RICIN domain-containing protein [Clostridia bacterium]|nr:RICIN domain-containing protein [Clostridia bacterium]